MTFAERQLLEQINKCADAWNCDREVFSQALIKCFSAAIDIKVAAQLLDEQLQPEMLRQYFRKVLPQLLAQLGGPELTVVK